MLSNLINCSKTCHHSNGRWVYLKKKTKLKQLKTHTSIKESKGSCLWQTAEEMCLYSLLRVVHPVQRMDLIQEFITKLQMQSLFVFWHQRGPRKWIGVWTNWHHSHKRRGKKFSKVWKFLSKKLPDFLWKLCSFFCTVHTLTVQTVENLFYSSSHTLLKNSRTVNKPTWSVWAADIVSQVEDVEMG